MENLVNKVLSAYQGKKVFVTGHTGFKGSWLISILSELKANVKGYALNPLTPGDMFNVINDNKTICESVIHDIRDKDKLKEEIISFQPDFIFHLAAQPLVRYSYEAPLETFEVNVMGTAYLLDAVRSLDKKCTVVIITTDKVYYNKETHYSYKEDDKLGGYDPYSSSKAMAELVTSSYRDSFFNVAKYAEHQKAIASARAGNVIGGGDWSKDRIIPDIVNALSNNKEIPLRNPNAVRPWQHVLEPLFGYLLLAAELDNDPKKFSGAWNFGPLPGDELTVSELVNKAIAVWGSGKVNLIKDTTAVHEAGLLHLDITKATSSLPWKPLLDADAAINWTIEWYRQQKNKQKEFTFHQIKQYLAL